MNYVLFLLNTGSYISTLSKREMFHVVHFL